MKDSDWLIVGILLDLVILALWGLLWSFFPWFTEWQNFWSFALGGTLILLFTYLQISKKQERGE